MKCRNFIKAGAVGTVEALSSPAKITAATPERKYKLQVSELLALVSRPPAFIQAVVIGSGFGSAISAYRLFQVGIQTTVLERGCRWPVDPWRKHLH